MMGVLQIGDLLRKIRSELRFGEWSRGSLHLIRIEVREKDASCDWLARPADEWDAFIPPRASAKHFALQALEDAIQVRSMIFTTLARVQSAELRAFRATPDGERELILVGSIDRSDKLPARSASLAMQAKLLGFHFTLSDGSLIRLGEENDLSPHNQLGSPFHKQLKEVS